MGKAMFYHLTQRPLEATLPVLLERALAQNFRVVIRGTDANRLDWLDQKLWLGPEEGFLPHGLAGSAHDALQPVLLTMEADGGGDRQCLMAVDGATVLPEDVARHERSCILFDGLDPKATDHARNQWRALSQVGAEAEYWSEDSGAWVCKHKTGGT